MNNPVILKMMDVLYCVREGDELTFFRQKPHQRHTTEGYDGMVAFSSRTPYGKQLSENSVYEVTMQFEFQNTAL